MKWNIEWPIVSQFHCQSYFQFAIQLKVKIRVHRTVIEPWLCVYIRFLSFFITMTTKNVTFLLLTAVLCTIYVQEIVVDAEYNAVLFAGKYILQYNFSFCSGGLFFALLLVLLCCLPKLLFKSGPNCTCTNTAIAATKSIQTNNIPIPIKVKLRFFLLCSLVYSLFHIYPQDYTNEIFIVNLPSICWTKTAPMKDSPM